MTNADIHDIHRAAMAAELPYCPECGGNGKVYAPQRECPCCSGTGRDGGHRAVAGLAGLKGELEVAWKSYKSGWPITHGTDHPQTAESLAIIRRQLETTHAAAIRRIATHIHAVTGDADLARLLEVE